jgi:hypothetical protein
LSTTDRPSASVNNAAGTGPEPATGDTRPPSTSPSGTVRKGRRNRSATRLSAATARPSFFERYRSLIFGAAAVGAIALVGGFVFLGATSPSYACTIEWEPDATPPPAAGASPRLGYIQPDMGRLHDVRSPQHYTYCPPASGTHHNIRGVGPILAGAYGPDDRTEPQGWIHNLEHGSLVVLYRCREGDEGCGDAAQAQLNDLWRDFPPSPICGLPRGAVGPVFTRFDDMAYPYAALVWNRVLPLESLDIDTIMKFFETEGERTHPEKSCPVPTPSPAGSPAASPEESPSPAAS